MALWFKFKPTLGESDANLRRDLAHTVGSQTESREMRHEEAVVIGAGRDRFVPALLAGVLVFAALYFGRIVLEPVAFVLFAMALVEPFQTAVRSGWGSRLRSPSQFC